MPAVCLVSMHVRTRIFNSDYLCLERLVLVATSSNLDTFWLMVTSRLQRHPQRTRASSQQGQAITHQGQAIIPQGQAVTPQGQATIPQVQAVTPQGQATIPQGPAISQQTPARTRLVQATSHQDLARHQVQATFCLALDRNILPALVIHQDPGRHQVQATSHLARARLQAIPPVQVTCHQATPRAPAPAASHPELLSILLDQAISLVATGLQGVAAATEQACIHQGRARRHHMVQGCPSTQGQLQ